MFKRTMKNILSVKIISLYMAPGEMRLGVPT